MKKLLLFLVLIILSVTSANAITIAINSHDSATSQNISPVASRTYYHPRYRRLPARPAVPRVACPARPAVPHRYRYIYYNYPPFVTYYNPPEQNQNSQPSRFSKDTKAIIPTKSYTMNGVTYYN